MTTHGSDAKSPYFVDTPSLMPDLTRATDWASTPLGPVDHWPQSLRTAVDMMLGSGHAMCIAWGKDRTLLYNDAYAPILGSRHPQALGKPFAEVWPEIWPEIEPLVERTFAGETCTFEDLPLLMTRNGYAEDTWWSFSYSPIHDEQGRVAGLLNVTLETTGRVLVERQRDTAIADLRASEARYRAIFENIDAGFCISEVKYNETGAPVDHRVVEANPAFERHTGLTDAVGRWANEIAPGIEQHWHDAYGHVARTGKPVRFEGEAKPLGRWYDAHLFPVADGRVAMLIADTTERRRTEDAVARNEAKWRTIFETLREGFILGELVRDEAGRVVDWRYDKVNNAWYDLVGIERGCAVGRTIREVFPGIEDAWIFEPVTAVETGEPVRFTRQVGTLGRWYDGVMQHAGDDHFTIIFTEVTDRVLRERRQAALIRLSDRLLDEEPTEDLGPLASAVLGETLGVELVGYGDIDPVAETITVERDWTAEPALSLSGTLRLRDYGLFIDDLKAGETVVVRDCRSDARTRDQAAAMEARGARAFVNIPMMQQGVCVAMLYVSTASPRDWTSDEVQFVRDVAYRVHVAIEQRRARAQEALLNGELAHRVKNTLSVVQAIANATLARTASDAAATEFGNRMKALASAHDVLLARSWSAAGFRQIAEAALASFDTARITISGPEVRIGSRTAMSLSLLLHELSTNAAKHGALSVPDGRVTLSWTILRRDDVEILDMRWAERGGPPAIEPSHRGFGSRIIRMGLTGSGGVKLHYDTEGLTADMSAPLHQIIQG